MIKIMVKRGNEEVILDNAKAIISWLYDKKIYSTLEEFEKLDNWIKNADINDMAIFKHATIKVVDIP